MFTGDLSSALNDYELLRHTSFRHHVSKRDLYKHEPDRREVEYDSFGRLVASRQYCFAITLSLGSLAFHILLQKNMEFLTSSCSAVSNTLFI